MEEKTAQVKKDSEHFKIRKPNAVPFLPPFSGCSFCYASLTFLFNLKSSKIRIRLAGNFEATLLSRVRANSVEGRTVQQWFEKIPSGNRNLGDAQRSGRSTAIQDGAFVETNPMQTVNEIA